MLLDRNCLECGVLFRTLESYVKRGDGKFCCTSCAARHGNRQRLLTGQTVNCASCDKPIYRKVFRINKSKTGKFYCNRKCKQAVEVNLNQTKNADTQIVKPILLLKNNLLQSMALNA